jgi:hypothetical protein
MTVYSNNYRSLTDGEGSSACELMPAAGVNKENTRKFLSE